ncbi:MAG TPA: nicotinate-nucleotide adenylyltransferase [Stellaceae bacterium]|nr:nicotinate-nucleotide adenylyltransferase [Stellaceae bacterium]
MQLPAILGDRRARRIGLLGGSFNPAHAGHRHISLLALSHLDLDEIWWMVSPQNPLKSSDGMAPQQERIAGALAVAQHPRIKVTGIEAQLGSRYTADTLTILCQRFPRSRFVWLMGADNLLQISRWEKWRKIFQLAPIAIFARPPYSLMALKGRAARVFAPARLNLRASRRLALMEPPAWVFFPTKLDPLSATEIRSQQRRSGRRLS